MTFELLTADEATEVYTIDTVRALAAERGHWEYLVQKAREMAIIECASIVANSMNDLYSVQLDNAHADILSLLKLDALKVRV